jgi:signal transduction histidine kinase
MRSLRTRLTILVFLIVLGTVGVLALGVLSSLEQALRDQKLRDLERSAHRFSAPLDRAIDRGAQTREINQLVRDAADAATARVTLLGVARNGRRIGTFLKSDSTRQVVIRDLRFAVAIAAIRRRQVVMGTETGDAGRIGEAALPLAYRDPRSGRRVVGSVVVYSAPLDAVTPEAILVRDRVVTAGLVALLAAALATWLMARAVSQRVRRLERVAERVAQGDLTARFPVDARDEIGQLARSLDEMRGQLAELDSARKRFMAIASHELRTPLFSLGGFLELLEEEELDEEDRRRFVSQLRQQVTRMQKLATDLLDLSRLEAGALELRTEPTDVAALARMVVEEFQPALSAHAARLELRLPDDPLPVECDPERVAQVLRILLDNAITHTPPGTAVVVAAARHGDRARLVVDDAGPGIPATMRPRVFEPFVTTDDAQGSGLGLAIAHELAERMEGELTVDSGPGRTRFTLELPARAVTLDGWPATRT